MYVLISKNIAKNYKLITRTINNYGKVIRDLSTLSTVPIGSRVIVFYENSIHIAHLLDLIAALDLDLTLVVNSRADEETFKDLIKVKYVEWDIIDGDIVNALQLNDDNQLSANTYKKTSKPMSYITEGLYFEAEKITNMKNASDGMKSVAQALMNIISANEYSNRELEFIRTELLNYKTENEHLKHALKVLSNDVDDFIKAYKLVQAQMSAKNIVNVIKDTNSVVLPPTLTTLVIKNYGVPNLMKFILALKDCLATSFDKYVKVLYIAEPDGVSIQEVNRARFLLLNSDTKATDLARDDLLLSVGSTRETIDFLTSSSTVEVLIIVDSRRDTNMLIKGQNLTLFTAMDYEVAKNMGLAPELTITSSERSEYTLRESDFTGKRAHALRNNEIVLRVANTLMGST